MLHLKYPSNPQNYQAFHEETKDSLFYQPDKVNLRVKIYDSEDEAQKAIEKLNSGTEFEELFNSWKVKTYYINKDGNTDSYNVNDPNYFGDEAFKLSEGESSGPVQFEENVVTKFAVIKASNVTEEKILSIDEIDPARLDRMFNSYYRSKINNKLAEDLKEKYSVKINEAVLKELVPKNR